VVSLVLSISTAFLGTLVGGQVGFIMQVASGGASILGCLYYGYTLGEGTDSPRIE
jgi:hypothetical protein